MLDDIQKAIAEIQQPRSAFQIERFVIGQHATPEMQYYQTLLELQDAIYKYRLAEIQIKKSELKIADLRESGTEIDELEAQEIELSLEQTQIAIIGAGRELESLIAIYDSFEHKFSRAEIEAAQPEYWKARLINNANAQLMAGQGVNPAHIESMKQAGILDDYITDVAEEQKRQVEK